MPSQRQAKRHKPSKPSKPSQRSSDGKALILPVDGATRELLLIYSAKHTGWGGFHAKQGGFHAAAAKCESQVGFTPKNTMWWPAGRRSATPALDKLASEGVVLQRHYVHVRQRTWNPPVPPRHR